MIELYENFLDSTADPGTRRRTVLKGLAAGAVGLAGIAGTAAAQGARGAAHERALYVWGYAPVLATDGAAQERFIERTDRFGIDTIYLSWGALRTAPPAAIGGLSGFARRNPLPQRATEVRRSVARRREEGGEELTGDDHNHTTVDGRLPRIYAPWGGGFWEESYYVGTAGDVSTDTIEQYIERTEHV